MLTCSHCDRILLWGWLRAETIEGHGGEELRVCGPACAEKTKGRAGSEGGFITAWIYQARPVAERRSA